jgi:arginyl-tRNA synthetase
LKKYINDILSKELHCSVVIEKIKDKKLGDFATTIAFSLAKKYKKSPVDIAKDLVKKFDDYSCFSSVNSVNGFINFTISSKFLEDYADKFLDDNSSIYQANNRLSMLLEFVSANPTGPLHLGHARGAVIGGALARIGRKLGHKIETQYYVNDAGKQMKMLGLSVLLRGREILSMSVEFPEEFYRGEYIKDLAQSIIDEFGEKLFVDSDIETISIYSKNKMLDLIKSDLKEVGIEFDSYISEKELYDEWENIKNILEQNNALMLKDKKVWLNTMIHGDEKNRVVIREDGVPTYLAGDIIYHNYKYLKKYDKYINIWGADHHGYISRVKSAIEYLGFDSKSLDIILIQMVSLLKNNKPYKMSKRSGGFILMSEISKEIGTDSLNYMFASKKCDTHLEFDLEKLSQQDSSNPLFYINYAHARIYSIFTKANKNFSDVELASFEKISNSAKELLFEALILPTILKDSFDSSSIQKLTDYTYNLSSQFHKFYNSGKIVGEEHEDSYLKVFSVVACSIKNALSMLNIEAKKEM